MKTTLVIMAAGIGSRFGGGIKQLAPVGMHGEIIIKCPLSVHFGMGEYADRISAEFTGNGEKFVGHQ